MLPEKLLGVTSWAWIAIVAVSPAEEPELVEATPLEVWPPAPERGEKPDAMNTRRRMATATFKFNEI